MRFHVGQRHRPVIPVHEPATDRTGVSADRDPGQGPTAVEIPDAPSFLGNVATQGHILQDHRGPHVYERGDTS